MIFSYGNLLSLISCFFDAKLITPKVFCLCFLLERYAQTFFDSLLDLRLAVRASDQVAAQARATFCDFEPALHKDFAELPTSMGDVSVSLLEGGQGGPPQLAVPVEASSSRRRIQLCLWGSPLLWGATWAISYVVWLSKGCVPYMPFVSDFGAGGSPTGLLFMLGMTSAALVWLPTWFDYHAATRSSVAATNSEYSTSCNLHDVQLAFGVFCSLGIVAVALNPEDERLVVHGMGANCAFCSGLAFCSIAALLRCRTGRSWKLTAALSGVGIFSFCAMLQSLGAATADGLDFAQEIKLIDTNFESYCKAKSTWPCNTNAGVCSMHANPLVNRGAFFEWLMLGAILSNILLTLTDEFGARCS